MEFSGSNLTCVFWVGATGVGKSAMALDMAEVFSAEIVNADSVQLYRGLDIGSAKPTPTDFLRRPHALFDVVDYPNLVTAGDYNRLFFESMELARDRQAHLQFVVGGTGFYFQAIEKGLLPVPKTDLGIQRQLEDELMRRGDLQLHEELRAGDPESAARIHPRDHYRLIRALEILRVTGRPPSTILREHQSRGSAFPFPLLKIGLRMERDELLARIRERTRMMLELGLVDEVRELIGRGQEDWEPLRSVGYRECLQFLRGKISSEAQLSEAIVKETMRLAKKQRTWFQRDSEIQWFHPSERARVEEALKIGLAVLKPGEP